MLAMNVNISEDVNEDTFCLTCQKCRSPRDPRYVKSVGALCKMRRVWIRISEMLVLLCKLPTSQTSHNSSFDDTNTSTSHGAIEQTNKQASVPYASVTKGG